jgi:hypothetical protein
MNDDDLRRGDDAPAEGASAPSDAGPADAAPGVTADQLDALAANLVWRVGRTSDDAPVTVRVGLPSAAHAFADLPKLRNATDAELADALASGDVRVEWVSPKARGA